MPNGKRKKSTHKKESFMQGVVTLIFSQVLIKLLGLVYTLYLTINHRQIQITILKVFIICIVCIITSLEEQLL